MKKFFVLLLSIICVFGMFGCNKDPEPATQQSQNASETVDDSALREKFPQYYAVDNHFKGVEVYVWELSEGEYRCGVLQGTNRYKEIEELIPLTKNGATIEEMKIILSSCGISRGDISLRMLRKVGMTMYEIVNDVDYQTLEKIFWGN